MLCGIGRRAFPSLAQPCLLERQAETGAEAAAQRAAGAPLPAGRASAAQGTGAPAAASAAAREPGAGAAPDAEPAALGLSAREGGLAAGDAAAGGLLGRAAAAPSAWAGGPAARGPGAGELRGSAATGDVSAAGAGKGALRPDLTGFLARGGFDGSSALYRAAVRIQASYRGYSVRKARRAAPWIMYIALACGLVPACIAKIC